MSKKKLFQVIGLALLLIYSPSIKGQENQPEGYYVSIYGNYDLMASNHPPLIEDGLFTFYLGGFIVIGIDAGKYIGKNNYHISISRGFAYPEYNIRGDEPIDNEVELQKALSLAVTYRKQGSRIKKTNRVKVNFGGRCTAIFSHYSGIKAKRGFDSSWGRPTYTFEDFGMNTIGIEAAPYLEIGKQAPGEKGMFLNWEYLYFRVGYKNVALGAQKVSIILKF